MDILELLNNNKLFTGCVMIIMNVGGRYIATDLPSNMDKIFANIWVRRLVVFCVAFIATRDIRIAIFITLMFILVFHYLLNEKNEMNILKYF